jgi:hypothetical protein
MVFVKWEIQGKAEQAVKKLKWTGSIIEFVELVYALHAAGKLGEVSLKNAFAVLSEMFDMEVKNYYRLFWDIKNRVKGDRTVFLDSLKKVMAALMEKLDGKR